MLPVPLAVLVLRDELVEVVEALVVARVRHHVAGFGHDHVGALVLEAAQRGVLLRGRRRVEGVDFHDPAEAVGLVGGAGVAGVEARVVEFPLSRRGLVGQPVALVLGRGAGRDEVPVEVLLAGEDGAPGGGAAGAVAQRAEDAAPGGVGGGPDQRRAGHRAGELVRRVVEVAAVQPGALDVGPRRVLVLAFQLDDGEPVRGGADLPDIGGGHRGREHDGLVGVFVVGEQHGAAALAAGDLEDVGVVVVVAELPRLRRRGLVAEVEVRGVVEDRVTPADHGLPGEAFRDGDGVDGGIHRGDGGELELGRAVAVLGGRGQAGAAGHGGLGRGQGRTERDGERTGGAEAQGGAAGHGRGGDVAEVAVRAGVADLAGAGVVALERAGDGASLAFGVAEHGEQGELASGGDRHGETFHGWIGGLPTVPAADNAEPTLT